MKGSSTYIRCFMQFVQRKARLPFIRSISLLFRISIFRPTIYATVPSSDHVVDNMALEQFVSSNYANILLSVLFQRYPITSPYHPGDGQ
jgi:hypothetical protein